MASEMQTFAARLASFEVAHPASKRRTSNAKNAKTLKWPHQNPSAAQVAYAGFFYQPSSTSPDSTTCFVCERGLDGWEADDDPLREHLSYSPECAWAIILKLEREMGEGRNLEDPTSEKMMLARQATFVNWPHDGKRGWLCKTQKMAEAGWYYCPTPESDDSTKCPYCYLNLDGWEAKDKPWEEHQKRSTSCAFFSLQEKPTRPKGRLSKASRISVQSNLTEPVGNDDDVIKTKRGTKGRNKGSKAAVKSAEPEPESRGEPTEPEDDDFEIKIDAPKGKKRKSEDIELDLAPRATRVRRTLQGQSHDDVDTLEEPRSKKPTRKRASTLKAASKVSLTIVPDAEIEAVLEADLDRPLTDDELEELEKDENIKAKRTSQRAGTTSVRKISTARKASAARMTSAAMRMSSTQLEESEILADETQVVPAQVLKVKKSRATKSKMDNQTDALLLPSEISIEAAPIEKPQIKPTRKASRQVAKAASSEVPICPVEQFEPETNRIDAMELDAVKSKPAKKPRVLSKAAKAKAPPIEIREDVEIQELEAVTIAHEVLGKAKGKRMKAQTRVIETQLRQESHPLQESPPPTPVQSTRTGLSSPTPSPQASDAENQPPSHRPSHVRPPLGPTPQPSTPVSSKSNLQTTWQWSRIDIEKMLGSPADQENLTEALNIPLTRPEKNLTVEEWIKYNAEQNEQRLRSECERITGIFENAGVGALKSLEGIICTEKS